MPENNLKKEMLVKPESSSGAEVAKGASYLFVQGFATSASDLLFLLVAARILSIPEIGAVSALGVLGTFFLTIGTFAVPSSIIKYTSEYIGKNRQDIVKGICKRALGFGVLAGLLAFLACFVLSATLSQLIAGNASLQPVIAILAFNILILVVNTFLNGVLFGFQKFRAMAFVGIAVSGIKLFVALFLIIRGLGLVGVATGWVAGNLVGSFLLLFYVYSSFSKEKDSGELALTELFKYSLPLYGASIVAYFSATIDRLVVLSFSNLAVLGAYSVAVAAVNTLGIVSSSIGSSLFPQLSQIQGRYGASALNEVSAKASRYLFIIMTPLTLGLAVIAYPTIELFFGESYTSAWLCLSIVAVAATLTSADTIVSNLLLSLGMTKTTFTASVAGVTVAIVVSALLVSPLGSIGAAFGRFSLMLASFSLSAIVLKKKMGLHLDTNALKKCLFCGGVMAVTVAIIQLITYNKYLLLAYVAVGGIAYALMLKLLGIINSEDFQLLKEISPESFHGLIKAFARFFS